LEVSLVVALEHSRDIRVLFGWLAERDEVAAINQTVANL
jgi:hypothetical protein